MTIESMIYFMIMMINLSKPVKALGESFARIQKTIVSAGFVFEILDLETETQKQSIGHPIIRRGEVEFRNVTFSYNGTSNALRNINIRIKAGESIALVGPSGSGKTSLINLIPRFYELKSGEILIDGVNTKTVPLIDLRSQIAIVPQEVILFAATIYENIRYGRLEASDEDILAASHSANAHEFIERMEKGYQTEIGERGVQLSGGQRQRIAIARAILRNPRILLLDEATSALDTESEKMVQEALNHLMKDRTSLVIAHRLSTVTHCDRIIVLEGGSIIEEGTHEQLMRHNRGLYKRLRALQFEDQSSKKSSKS
jgi:subfamily B ATP-binding cassette protein MsbA